MSGNVDPQVLEKLESFGARRRQLIQYRGICVGLATFIGSMMLVALVDWIFFLPDEIRLALSGIGYAAVLGAVWYTCLRLIKVPSTESMAKLIETAEPSLREELLAAVELGGSQGQKQWDSLAFRESLQHNVAHKMHAVNVQSLLPWGLIRRWVNVAMVATLLVMVLLCIPGLRFGQRLARAVVPIADVARVSSTTITVVSPSPANTTLASGEQIDIVVRIGGPASEDHVVLETIREDGKSSRVEMSRAASGQRTFQSTVRIGRQSLEYRIWANDTRSDIYLIASKQRPEVISFEKTVHYPAYLQRQPQIQTDQSGDLSAVIGSSVELVVEVNQPVTLAHINTTTDSGTQAIAMTPDMNNQGELQNRLRARVPIESSGSYRISLVAAESGLENRFSPEYLLRAHQDAPPSIHVEQPPPAILVPPDEIVEMIATASDDYALRHIEQHTRIGQQPWEITKIADVEPAEAESLEIQRSWDLFPMQLSPGTVVYTKLVAIDRKGNQSESRTIRAVISSHQFDPQRLASLQAARKAFAKLSTLQQKGSDLLASVGAARSDQSVLTALDHADQYDAAANETLQAIETAIAVAAPGRQSTDLVRVGRSVSQASTVGVGFIRRHLTNDSHEAAVTAARFVDGKLTTLANCFDELLRLSELAVLSQDIAVLERMQRDTLARAGGDQERVAQRMVALGSQADVVARFLENMRHHASLDFDQRLAVIIDHLDKVKELGDVFAGPITEAAVRQSGDSLGLASTETNRLFREQLLSSIHPREQLQTSAGATESVVARASKLARDLYEHKQDLGEQAVRGNLDQLQDQAIATKRIKELSTAAFDAATASLLATARLEQKRPDSRSQFVADTSRAARTIEAARVQTQHGGGDEIGAIDRLDRLTDALTVINAVHQIDDLIGLVTEIQKQETSLAHASQSVYSETAQQLSNWFAAEAHYSMLQSRFGRDPISQTTRQRIRDTQHSDPYRRVRAEMVARAQPDREAEDREEELAILLSDLTEIRSSLVDQWLAARSQLQDLSPRLDQMLADLARQVREEEDETRQLAEADQEQQEDIEAEIAQQQQDADQIHDRLDEIQEALVEAGLEQDLMTEEGREQLRDTQDALAMLEEPPVALAEALEQAAQGEDIAQQQAALAEAARQQAVLAERLEQISEHFENLREGDAEESRQQLRDQEQALGIQEELQQQSDQLEQLANIAELPPEQALEQLEQQLQQDPQMQRALDEITRNQLQQAQGNLESAQQRQSDRNQAVSEQIEQARGQQQPPSEMVQQLERIAQAASELAEQELNDVVEQLEDEEPIPPNPFDRDRDLNEELAEEIQDVADQLEQIPGDINPSGQPSAEDLAGAAEALSERLRDAAQRLQESGQSARDEAPGSDAAQQIGEQADRAARNAAALAERAEQLAEEIQNDVTRSEESWDDAGDVWEDPEQEAIAEQVRQAQDQLQQAARHQERLGNQENAEDLQQIANEAADAVQRIEDFAEQATGQGNPTSDAALSENEVLEQLSAAEQAIGQPAEQLERFLNDEPLLESPPSQGSALETQGQSADPGDPLQPSSSEPRGGEETSPGETQANELDLANGENIPENPFAGGELPGAETEELGGDNSPSNPSEGGEPSGSESGSPSSESSGGESAGEPSPGSESSPSNPSEGSEPSGSEPGSPSSESSGSESAGEPSPSGSESSPSSPSEGNEPSGSEPGSPSSESSGSESAGEPSPSGSESSPSSPSEGSESSGSESGSPSSESSGGESAGEPSVSGNESSPSSPSASGSESGSPSSESSGSESASEPSPSGSESLPSSPSAGSESSGSESGSPSSESSGSESAGVPSVSGSESSPDSSSQASQGSASPSSGQTSSSGEGNSPASNPQGSRPSDSSSTPLGRSAARQLAEALNELDQQINGPTAQSPSAGESAPQGSGTENPTAGSVEPQQSAAASDPPAASDSMPPNVGQAIAQAAQSQAQQFSQGRSNGQSSNPSSSSSSQGYSAVSQGASVGGEIPQGQIRLPAVGELTKEDWARLPPKLAADLMDGSREKIAPEYRKAVETYFRLLAERAREE